jgi:hypothetical protein
MPLRGGNQKTGRQGSKTGTQPLLSVFDWAIIRLNPTAAAGLEETAPMDHFRTKKPLTYIWKRVYMRSFLKRQIAFSGAPPR